jgi:hypothetical protein
VQKHGSFTRLVVIGEGRRDRYDEQHKREQVVKENTKIGQSGSKGLSPVHVKASLLPLYRRIGIPARLPDPRGS